MCSLPLPQVDTRLEIKVVILIIPAHNTHSKRDPPLLLQLCQDNCLTSNHTREVAVRFWYALHGTWTLDLEYVQLYLEGRLDSLTTTMETLGLMCKINKE